MNSVDIEMRFDQITRMKSSTSGTVMKSQILLLVAMFALIVAGCQKPTEVQLVNEQPTLEFEQVIEPDSTIDRASVDSTALLPKDQDRNAGFITLTSTKSDFGSGIESKIAAKVVFENRSRVLVGEGGRKQFFALPLLFARLNGDPLFPRERRVLGLSAGFEYVRDAIFIPRNNYRFTGASDSIGTFDITVQAPENLTVQSPVGGMRVPKDKDVELRWTGQGELSFIVSVVRIGVNNQPKLIPLLNVRAKKNFGYARLSKKILNDLPRGVYILTFVVSNKDERQMLGSFRNRVLIQASSIYNVRVDLI